MSELRRIALGVIAEHRSLRATVSRAAEAVSEALLPSAHAAYLDIPPIPLRGIVCHLLISHQLVTANPGLLADLSLEKLADVASEFLAVPAAHSKRRPDLTRLAGRAFWEIKSRTSVQLYDPAIRTQMAIYAAVGLQPGGVMNLLGYKSDSARVDLGGTVITCEYQLVRAGLISYSPQFTIDRLVWLLTAAVVERFIREMKARLGDQTAKALSSPAALAVIAGLALLVVLLLLPEGAVAAALAGLVVWLEGAALVLTEAALIALGAGARVAPAF